MEKCFRCERSEEEVRLFDGFYIIEEVKVCEKCSIIENIPIIKMPSSAQLKESEKGYGIRERLSAMAGLKREERKEKTREEELRIISEKPELEKPSELVFKLVDNFHWIIMTNRRRKGLTVHQMAEAIGESESALKMLEKGIIPGNSLNLIEKIEQLLNVMLIKKDYYEKIREKAMAPEKKVIVIEKPKLAKEEPEHIKEIMEREADDMVRQAILTEKNPKIKAREQVEGTPLRITDFRRDKIEGITVADLKRIEENVERDFELEHLKRADEIGREQVEDFGKEDMKEVKKSLHEKETKGASQKPGRRIPSIYDLVREKKEKEKKSIMGREIEVEKIENFSKIKEAENEPENIRKEEKEAEKKEEEKQGQDIFSKIEDASMFVRKKRKFLSRIKKAFGIESEEEKIDFETGKIIKYE
jgi:ribosome-binding protein aMBF1 (putative translation factor)